MDKEEESKHFEKLANFVDSIGELFGVMADSFEKMTKAFEELTEEDEEPREKQ